MRVNHRQEHRRPSSRVYSVSWQDEQGLTHSVEAQGRNRSKSGVGVRCSVELKVGTTVYIQSQEGLTKGYGLVRHCFGQSGGYVVGLELNEANRDGAAIETETFSDHYEFLQISPKAQSETIQRVYRFLAARYHPDNPETGDPEIFLQLNKAYAVLSDPERRAKYDATLKKTQAQPNALFGSVDFLDGVDGEVNRRLGVLSLLYRRCRANVHSPHISLLSLEAQMGFPREYLDFTIWYLRSKKYIKQEDNAEFALTSMGVDYIEENYPKLPLLRKLLDPSSRPNDQPGTERDDDPNPEKDTLHVLGPGQAAQEEFTRLEVDGELM